MKKAERRQTRRSEHDRKWAPGDRTRNPRIKVRLARSICVADTFTWFQDALIVLGCPGESGQPVPPVATCSRWLPDIRSHTAPTPVPAGVSRTAPTPFPWVEQGHCARRDFVACGGSGEAGLVQALDEAGFALVLPAQLAET